MVLQVKYSSIFQYVRFIWMGETMKTCMFFPIILSYNLIRTNAILVAIFRYYF